MVNLWKIHSGVGMHIGMENKMNENTEEMVTISKKEYESLCRDSAFLLCLRSNGVDNWDWYGEACNMFESEYPEYA